tara:strand:- start:2515 stop:3177 length:663 start_codon:yes stop_codon:yes gene_type:complete
MQALDLISSTLIYVSPSDTGSKALDIMDEFRVNHLAVVKDNFYLAIISDNEILSWNNTNEYIDEHLAELTSPNVIHSDHLFRIIEILEKNSLSIVPVLDENKNYIGSITNRKLLFTIAKSTVIQSQGDLIVLEINQRDYDLSKVASIIESNNIKILSSYITSKTGSAKTELTLKLNSSEIDPVIKALERFNYNVVTSYRQINNNDDFIDRYESLMRFLNP